VGASGKPIAKSPHRRMSHHVQVSIPRGAEDEARRFYGEVLGLMEIPKPPALAGRGGFWLSLGEMQIHFGVEDGVDRLADQVPCSV